MTDNEQAAFVNAFCNNVASVDEHAVADFVARYAVGEDIDYDHNYTPIMDALGMWNDAIRWQLEQQKGASNV
jgi:hypothetical protein